LIDLPVLPFVSFNNLTRRSKLRRVSRFSGPSPRQAGSLSPKRRRLPRLPASVTDVLVTVALRRRPLASLRPPALRPSSSVRPTPRSGRLAAFLAPPVSRPSTSVRRGLRCLHHCPELWSSPESSYSLAPIRLGRQADACRPPPVGQIVVRFAGL